MPAIKISGITNKEDAKWAAILGVDFVSVSLMEGDPRKTSDEMARNICQMLPSYTEVILELDSPNSLSKRRIEKISPVYISTPLETQESGENIGDGILSIRKLEKLGEATQDAEIIEIRIGQDLDEEVFSGLVSEFSNFPLIIEGDLELPLIKSICSRYQMRAWSVRNIISRSPRRIDYSLMKEYIREISLW
ncbi:MAG: hypothetical protein GX817_00750 [Elusimicrobia bacterium]|nr:hypothetical protein [Elusimicrobiota bacterium]